MEKLTILTYPNNILLRKSIPVKKEKIVEFVELARAMMETMIINNGVGLAAPQIGKNICLIVVNKEAVNLPDNLILFNPKITFSSKTCSIIVEGCLSLPKIYKKIERPEKVRVKAYNEIGEKIQLKAKGLLAHVLQHEIDHLHGILIIDRAANAK